MIAPPSLLDRAPSRIVRRAVLRMLFRAVARAFGADVPVAARRPLADPDDLLERFRAWTADLIGRELAASAGGGGAGGGEAGAQRAADRRDGLYAQAFRLGSRARRLLRVRGDEAFAAARFAYRCIGIELAGELPGTLRFERCYFSRGYSPAVCSFMGFFDGGFMAGLVGVGVGGSGGGVVSPACARCATGANPLRFSQRITEGAPRCVAVFSTQPTGGEQGVLA